jgi:putative GTP pyrophosphokinase
MTKFNSKDLDRVCKEIVGTIEDELERAGLLCRIFGRVKTSSSLAKKIERKPGYYSADGKKLQDLIGIRVVLYFADDVEIVYSRLKTFFSFVDETIDKHEETKFAPTRINLILKIPEKHKSEIRNVIQNNLVDETFEIQIRTMLSEGWHEIDHDLRYKCSSDWNAHLDVARNLNGIFATLETSEYATLRLFDQLAFRHYKAENLEAMLRTKFRLRFSTDFISADIRQVCNKAIIRLLFKLDRQELIKFLFNSGIIVPITMDNLILIANYKFIGNLKLLDLIPSVLKGEIETSTKVLAS